MSSLYERGRESFLNGQISYANDNIKVCLLSSSYLGGNSALYGHSHYSDIAAAVIPSHETCITLTGKTTSVPNALGNMGGVAGANNLTFHSAAAGYTVGYFVLFKDSGGTIDGPPASPAASPLILMVDAGYGIGLKTNGGDINLTWDGINKIFKL